MLRCITGKRPHAIILSLQRPSSNSEFPYRFTAADFNGDKIIDCVRYGKKRVASQTFNSDYSSECPSENLNQKSSSILDYGRDVAQRAIDQVNFKSATATLAPSRLIEYLSNKKKLKVLLTNN